MTNTESGKPAVSVDQPSERIVSPTQETDTTASATKKKSRLVSKLPPIESLAQLLRAIYTGAFKRSTLKKSELVAMRFAPALDVLERQELLALTRSDRTLYRTRQLMLIGTGPDSPDILGQVTGFSCEVLRHHPAFSVESLAGVFDDLSGEITEAMAVRALASQDYASLQWPEDSKRMSKKEAEQCKANALHCLLLFFWCKRGMSVERIQRHLQSILWAPVARRYKTEAEKLRTLITTRDPVAASVTYGLLEKQVLEHGQRTEAACREEERATSQSNELKEQLAGVEDRLAGAQREVDRLKNELQQATQTHANDKAHMEDDYAQLRGQFLRRLKDEVSLLDEGLHALRRDPPKVHVMIDHAERAIDGLRHEMERLRGSG